MKFIITGATGHIGNNVVRKLVENKENNVVCLLRRDGKALAGLDCQKVFGNLFDKSFLEKHIDKNDTVIHSAGYIDLTDKKRELCYKVNVELTTLIKDVCLKKGAHLIYIGTVDAIYKEGNEKILEPDAYYPEKVAGHYAKSKAEATNILLSEMNKNPDFICDIVLPTAVIGINDYKPSAAGKIIKSTLRGLPEIAIHGGYNFVDVTDVVSVILTLAKNPMRQQFIVSGENLSVVEFYKRINNIKKFKRTPIVLPTFMAKPFLSKTAVKALSESHNYSSKKAKEMLGYKKTDFSKTLSDTINFFESIDITDK